MMENMTRKLPIIYTFGCRMNTFESNCIHKMMLELKMTNFIVVNTCAITAESERQCRQEVRKLHRENPDLHILITGCSGQFHTQNFLDIEGVDFVIGNEFKLQKTSYILIQEYYDNKKTKEEVQAQLLTHNQDNIPENNLYNHFEIIESFEDRSRAFVPIQTGCNHFCAFCIVPFTRGKFKSFNAENIIQQVNSFVNNGYNEVVLTGIDITDYGKDIRGQVKIDTLGKLCKEILKQTNLKRLRLSSVDVAEIDDNIIDLIKNEPRFMPYFHISLQSGSNSVLKRMRRRHTYEDVIDFCQKIKKYRPDACFGADIIAGFPGETEEEFQKSLEIVKNAPITFIHAFPYSRREKTLAYLMNDDVPTKTKKERVKQLIQLGQVNLKTAYQNIINTKQNILVERDGKARCENFLQITLNEETVKNTTFGEIITLTITKENLITTN